MEERFETFTVLINRISRNIRRIKNTEMAEYNLKSHHISCIYYLYICGNLTSTELKDKCEEDKATISRSIDYLEQNGYIFCLSNNAKRYKAMLSLTEKGKEAGKRISAKIENVLSGISTELTEEQRLDFYKSLRIISTNLEKISKKD